MAIGDPERATQNRMIAQLCGDTSGAVGGLGWRYLGDWHKRVGNANIEPTLLRPWLLTRGHDPEVATKAIAELQRAARMDGLKLFEANRATYDMLRYGVQVTPGPGEAPVTVRFVDWDNPAANDLGLAEEVAVTAKNPKAYNKRPDLVMYVNGIAIGVVELKKSTVDLGAGIRQTLDNQRPEFIRRFFTTVQITFAGNDMQGLRYAAIQTPQPYWLAWKEEGAILSPLDRDVAQMLAPARFLELINDFILFDAGIKKLARPNQYFAVKAAQEAVAAKTGGVIWQTQGSGKSLIMVMLARWIREARPDARILVVTDRKELDEQIEAVFGNTGNKVRRAKSGADLLAALADPKDRVISSLVHKFGRRDEDELGAMIADIQRGQIGAPVGEFFVFIDEAHRTQSGKLALAMRMILPGAVFFGFTGTPLLRSDKQTSLEVFGPYIGTPYRFNEAVEDGVVLDLRYEARDIDQRVASPRRIDEWFEAKTKGLTPVAKATLKQRWGTLQRVLSSRDRLEQIANDIIMDMELKPRLKADRGNAMLVAGSIPEACRLFEIFRNSGSDLAGKCAIVTSYTRNASELTGEEAGMGETATYIYIDKQMRDHGLFQAICRVNRLDGDDKDYGYVVDYKDLFKNIETAVEDYTSGAFDAFDAADVEGLISSRAEKAGEDLMTARDAWFGLLDPVEQPKGDDQVLAYFSSPGGWETDPQADEKARRRQAVYRLAGAYARAFASVADDPAASGVNDLQLAQYRNEVERAISLRDALRLHSGDAVDMKQYEPAMRHLIDTYIKADESEVISHLDDISLIDLVASKGGAVEGELPSSLKNKRENVAEAIENNVRRLIIDETPVNPKFYERMSELLADLVKKRKDDAIAYAQYLEKIADLVRAVKAGHGSEYPSTMTTPGRKALYDNLGQDEAATMAVDEAIRSTAQTGWRGNKMKKRMLRRKLLESIDSEDTVDSIIEIIRSHDEY